jgi:polyferredoxin
MSQSPSPFRDQISTVPDDGKRRKWLYPKVIKGKLFRYRELLSYSFLTLLFAAPFIRLNGEQLVLLNVLGRKFVFFGLIFWPQDFYLFVLALISFMIFVVLFTVVFGRLFCGWICPQTIFLEMVFRRIEGWIEGSPAQRKRLDEGPLTAAKLAKKTIKHTIYLLISFFIANIFLCYLISSRSLLTMINEPVSMHLSGFISISIFTLVFYLVFSRMRELVCTVVCPYGRLQCVLLDNQSIIVAYDYQRGEPRGKKVKGEQQQAYREGQLITDSVPQLKYNVTQELRSDGAVQLAKAATQEYIGEAVPGRRGDCIDCGLCVQVCPTGIDIRNGTQMECVNCTACIDACDMVMEKIRRPARLIGFKSEEEIRHKKAFTPNKRIYSYAAVLFLLLGTLSYLLLSRTDVKTTILRAGGTLYQLHEKEHEVSNLYNAELVNKTSHPLQFEIVPDNRNVKIQYIQKEEQLSVGGSAKLTFFVILPRASIRQYKSVIGFRLMSGEKQLDHFETTFIAPVTD